MTKPTINSFSQLAELTIQQYERYIPSGFDESLTLLEKMNAIIQYLNDTGQLVNGVVEQWNSVMEWVMADGLTDSVNTKLDEMATDGTFDRIVNVNIIGSLPALQTTDKSKLVNAINENVGKINELTVNKADKTEVFSMANMGQDIKTALTGGSVAVVGVDSVADINVKKKGIEPYNTSFLIDGVNLFNKDGINNLHDKFYAGTGVLTNQSGTNVSNKIFVNAGDVIRITNDTLFGPTTQNTIFKGRFFDRNGTDLGNISDVATDFTVYAPDYCSFTVPSGLNISYLKVNYQTSKKDSWMVVKNVPYPTVYTPFEMTIQDGIKIDFKNVKNTLSVNDTKSDITKHNLIYNDYVNDFLTTLATPTLVDDFKGFESPSGKVLKVSYPLGNTNIAYSLRKFSTDLVDSANYKDVLFVTKIWTNSMVAGETAVIEFLVQAGDQDSLTSSNSFVHKETLTLENGVPKVLSWQPTSSQYKAFKNGLMGVTVKNASNPIDIYIMFNYVGFNSNLQTFLTYPISIDDYTKISEQIKSVESSKYLQHLLINTLNIGDSLTAGAYYDPSHNGASINENYPYYLAKLTGWNTVNAGVSGIDAKGWYNNESSKYDFTSYDTFVICLGTNNGLTDTLSSDVVGSDYTQYADTNTGDYCKIIEKIKADNPDAFIFLTNVYASSGDVVTTNNVINQIAQKYSLPIIDIKGSYGNPIEHPFGNTVHFGKVGNLNLAKTIQEGIVSDINTNPSKYEVVLL